MKNPVDVHINARDLSHVIRNLDPAADGKLRAAKFENTAGYHDETPRPYGERPARKQRWAELDAEVQELQEAHARLDAVAFVGETRALQLEQALRLRDQLMGVLWETAGIADPEQLLERARRELADHTLEFDGQVSALEQQRESLNARIRARHTAHAAEREQFLTDHQATLLGSTIVTSASANPLQASVKAGYLELCERHTRETTTLAAALDDIAHEMDALQASHAAERDRLQGRIREAGQEFLELGIRRLQLLLADFGPLERAIASGKEARLAAERVKQLLAKRIAEAVGIHTGNLAASTPSAETRLKDHPAY